MAKSTVYLETTVISYLTAWPSRDIVREGHRQITRNWWDQRRSHYDLYISQVVMDEITKGDPSAATDRLVAIQGIPLLAVNSKISAFAAQLVGPHALPPNALQDAFHIATAAYHGIDILLTWNCTHIANPIILSVVRRQLFALNLKMPEIATPEFLMGDSNDA
jgi:predicted nucleic acid-binding protein